MLKTITVLGSVASAIQLKATTETEYNFGITNDQVLPPRPSTPRPSSGGPDGGIAQTPMPIAFDPEAA